MIAYVDTSALIPLIIDEPGSGRAGRVWDTAEHLTSVRLIYAEAHAALGQAARLGRLSDAIHLAAAERVASETTVLVSGDRELRAAAEALGLAVVDTSSRRDAD